MKYKSIIIACCLSLVSLSGAGQINSNSMEISTVTQEWDKTFAKLTGDNKELMIIPDASHTDLYDRMDIIPFDKITTFFNKYLK